MTNWLPTIDVSVRVPVTTSEHPKRPCFFGIITLTDWIDTVDVFGRHPVSKQVVQSVSVSASILNSEPFMTEVIFLRMVQKEQVAKVAWRVPSGKS